MEVKRFQVGTMKLEIHASKRAAGSAAARATAETLKELVKTRKEIGVIFATGASQLEMLSALTSMPDLPWKKVQGFHLDEYLGIDENHPASFRRYLRENLPDRLPMGEFFAIDGSSRDSDGVRQEYVQELNAVEPQLCLLGIGENGHLAFNDPAEANFADPLDARIVDLDTECKQQQVAEGWFSGL